MKHLSTAMIAVGLSTAAFAQDQELDFDTDRVFFDGYLELSLVDEPGGVDTMASAVLDFGLQPKMTGFGVDLGLSFGLDIHQTNGAGIDTEIALYAAGEVGMDSVKLSFGLPRSVVDRGYLPQRKFGYLGFLDVTEATDTSTFAATHLFGHDPAFGARVDGDFGATKAGLSYHKVDQGAYESEYYALAVSHTLDQVGGRADVLLTGAYEAVKGAPSTPEVFRLGADANFGKIQAGLSLVDGENIAWAELYSDYAITDQLTANVSYRAYDGGPEDFYAIGAEYTFNTFGFADVSYLDVGGPGSNSIYEMSVGVKF